MRYHNDTAEAADGSVFQDASASEHFAARYRQHGFAQDASASEHFAAVVQAAT